MNGEERPKVTKCRRDLLAQTLFCSGGGAFLAACTSLTRRPALFHDLSEPNPRNANDASRLTPLGRILYVSNRNIHVWASGKINQLSGDQISSQPSWSPDGQFIAHIKVDGSSSDIWVMDDDGAQLWRLTYYGQQPVESRRWAFRPRYWPTGDRLLYLSDETTHDLMIWQLGLNDQRGRPLLWLPDGSGGLDHPSISPAEDRLLFTSYQDEVPQVWTKGLPDGPWQQLTKAPHGAYDPAWSPDGKHIAYAQREADLHNIWIMDSDGHHSMPVTSGGRERAPCWSPVGDLVAYISDHGGFDVWVTPIFSATRMRNGEDPLIEGPRQLTKGAAVDVVSGLSWTG